MQRIAERQLIALLLYLLGFVANDFHIETSKFYPLSKKREGDEKRKRGSASVHVILRNKQVTKQIVLLSGQISAKALICCVFYEKQQ